MCWKSKVRKSLSWVNATHRHWRTRKMQSGKIHTRECGRRPRVGLPPRNVSLTRHTPSVMVSAFNDPAIWEGHASMMTEVHNQLPRKPDAIFCSVGGGGLLGGIIVGCKNVGWDDGE